MKNCLTYKFIISLILILGFSSALAQREKNNIFIFDCTGSMINNGLWQPARQALDATISAQKSIPGSTFCIIPFGDNPYENISFSAAEYTGKNKTINQAFDKYIKQAKNTHISDALEAGFKMTDPNKENKIYLLTDGLPNSGDGTQKVAATITKWCGNHRNSRLFYVALRNGVINPAIQQAIDACKDAYIVQCNNNVIPQLADISPSEIYTNLEELNHPKVISFSLPGKYPVVVESTDPLFDVKIEGNAANGEKITLTLSPKGGNNIESLHQLLHGKEYSFPITLQCVDVNKSFIANPTIIVNVADEVPAELIIAGGVDELRGEGVKWYDKFLWADAAPDQVIIWDLEPAFRNALPDSRLVLALRPKGGEKDYKAAFNGKTIDANGTMQIIPGEPAILEIQFDHDAKEGKRYFTLVPTAAENIDMINGVPVTEYEGTSIRTSYDVVWNPLKLLIVILAIILLGTLILWFAILKRIFFPTFKKGRLTLTGPGTYFGSKKLKGARKIILTSKTRSQNIFSRIFTGEVRFVRADQFSPELAMQPVGRGKKLKIRPEGKIIDAWDIYPSSILAQYDKGKLTNRNSNETTEIEFN